MTEQTIEKSQEPKRSRYIKAWEYHIQELTALALAANLDYDRYLATKTELLKWLEMATERLYTKE